MHKTLLEEWLGGGGGGGGGVDDRVHVTFLENVCTIA